MTIQKKGTSVAQSLQEKSLAYQIGTPTNAPGKSVRINPKIDPHGPRFAPQSSLLASRCRLPYAHRSTSPPRRNLPRCNDWPTMWTVLSAGGLKLQNGSPCARACSPTQFFPLHLQHQPR